MKKLVGLAIVIGIVSTGIFFFLEVKKIDKENTGWTQQATQEQKMFVEDIRKKLKIIRPYDFIVMKGGSFGYVETLSPIYVKESFYSGKKAYPDPKYSSDKTIFQIKKIVSRESKEYDILAGKFLRNEK